MEACSQHNHFLSLKYLNVNLPKPQGPVRGGSAQFYQVLQSGLTHGLRQLARGNGLTRCLHEAPIHLSGEM